MVLQRDIFWYDFDYLSESGYLRYKERPIIVVSCNEHNNVSEMVVIARCGRHGNSDYLPQFEGHLCFQDPTKDMRWGLFAAYDFRTTYKTKLVEYKGPSCSHGWEQWKELVRMVLWGKDIERVLNKYTHSTPENKNHDVAKLARGNVVTISYKNIRFDTNGSSYYYVVVSCDAIHIAHPFSFAVVMRLEETSDIWAREHPGRIVWKNNKIPYRVSERIDTYHLPSHGSQVTVHGKLSTSELRICDDVIMNILGVS